MGSGKSRVGQLLAKKLDWFHYDTDEMITKQVGTSIADIINSQGEAAFREMEKKAMALVGLMDQCVISTGGGAPLDPVNMENLRRNGEVVLLKVSPETVLKRIKNIASRPLIDPKDPLSSIRTRLKEREQVYAQADHIIESDLLSPEEIVSKILQMIPISPSPK